MKKGFTLIELLAVIVILAIIATIAVPIVLSIINDTKESALFRSGEFYTSALEQSIATATLNGITIEAGTYSIMQDGNVCIGEINDNVCDGNILKVEIKGEKPTQGTVKIEEGKINKLVMTLSGKEITQNSSGEFEYYTAPGLYDENDNLLISWEDLTSTDYQSFTHGVYDKDDIFLGEVTSAILNVDENGVLTSAYDSDKGEYYTAEYLVGKLVIDDTVTSIGEYAFFYCTSLESIIIPNSVTSIGNLAFFGCTSLTSITIPDSVTSIGDNAFSGCESLTSITIPSSVTSIGNWAFSGCTSLESITIPNGVTSIGDSAFWGCSNLTTINYTGTEANWNAISKGTNWDYNTPSNKEIKCTG